MIVIIHKSSYTKCWLGWVLFERKRPWLSAITGVFDCSLFLRAKFVVKQHLFHNILPLSYFAYRHNCSSCAWHSGGWWGHREGRCCNCHPGVGWCTHEGCGGQDCSQWQVSTRREVNSIVANLKCNHAVSPAIMSSISPSCNWCMIKTGKQEKHGKRLPLSPGTLQFHICSYILDLWSEQVKSENNSYVITWQGRLNHDVYGFGFSSWATHHARNLQVLWILLRGAQTNGTGFLTIYGWLYLFSHLCHSYSNWHEQWMLLTSSYIIDYSWLL